MMPRSRKAQRADDRQLAFTLAVEVATISPPAPTGAPKKAIAPLSDHAVPYMVRGMFRFNSGRECERTVCAVSPSREAFERASARLIARMSKSGWHFAEGNAMLATLLEVEAIEEPMTTHAANRIRTPTKRHSAPRGEGGDD